MSEDKGKDSSKPENDNRTDFPTLSRIEPIEEIGTQIGQYKLLSILGEGGFGIVYRALQKEPIRREVALKIIKPGMDSKQVIARFESERQALALLDHPNIAHVFDGGTTESGRPYFVMELVKGYSITKYCDQHKLKIEDRLKLFQQVCEAVQHAHQKGIIHRDIKPSNILVPVQAGKPVPMIIDFGVAKAISQPLTERTFFTEQGQFIGTPEYMSPEQAGMTIYDVDIRSDIYSLGVILYELLTGVLPFSRSELKQAGLAEIQRIIRESEPPRPSTKLSGLGEEAKKIAERRSTQITDLTRRMQKELEWIPLKAMRKEPDRRYKTASELADDIRNYINGDPLIAGPESTSYRLKKIIKRHRALVTGIAAVLIVLLAGIIVSTIFATRALKAEKREREQRIVAQLALKDTEKALADVNEAKIQAEKNLQTANEQKYFAQQQQKIAEKAEKDAKDQRDAANNAKNEAKRQAEIAEEITNFLTYDLLGAIDPERYTGEEDKISQDISIRYILDAASGRLSRRLKDAPLVEAGIRRSIGLMYKDLGLYNAAEYNLKRALTLYRKELGEKHRDTLGSMSNLGLVYKNQRVYEKAEKLFSEALTIGRSSLSENDPWFFNFMTNLGGVYTNQERYEEAENLYEEALKLSRRARGDQDYYTLQFMNSLARLYTTCPNPELRNSQKAVSYATEACELTNGENREYINTLAKAYAQTGDLKPAVKWLKRTSRLDLSGTAITDTDIQYVNELNLLQSLNVSDTQITDKGLEYIKNLTSLENLYLSGTQITGVGLENLNNLTQLHTLCMHNTRISDTGLVHLRNLDTLQYLCLHDTSVSDSGLAYIKDLTQITTLKLYNTQITDSGLEYIKNMRLLQYLDIEGINITDAGLEFLRNLHYLELLYLSGTHITDSGLECLKDLRSLEYLYLDRTNITDSGLSNLKNLTKLQSLYLRRTQVSNDGLVHLKDLSSLKRLVLYETNVTEEGLKDIRRSLPNCLIYGPSISISTQEKTQSSEAEP